MNEHTLHLTAAAEMQWTQIEAAAAEGETPVKVPQFSMLAYTGGPMRLAGFSRPVVVDLAGAKAASKSLPVFRDHDSGKVIGHGAAEITPKQISLTGIVSADNEHARDVVTSGRRGFPWQASIGATQDERLEFIAADGKTVVNGQQIKGPVLIARHAVINEISVVAIGADRRTSTRVAASGCAGWADPEFADWLLAAGFDPATLNVQQRTLLRSEFVRLTR